jgi:outer membrane protein assembly factor BamB
MVTIALSACPRRFAALVAAVLASSSLIASDDDTTAVRLRNWPQWRGPLATGVAPHAQPPTRWSETENVRWKIPVPGRGTATPIVWENRVYVLTAVPVGPTPGIESPAKPAESGPGGRGGPAGMTVSADQEQRWALLALDRASGKVVWEHTAREQRPHAGHHRDHGYASASPVTDGTVLIAHFGSYGTYAYDLSGRLLWEKDLGDMSTRNSFGEGSSPALHGDYVVVLWDHEGDDFVAALNKRTGAELWRQRRDEPTGWSTPVIVEHAGQAQVVVNGTNKVRAYDLGTGRLLWECSGQTQNAIPTPVVGEGVVYVTSGFRGNMVQAIRLGASGELSNTNGIIWARTRHTPYVPSPLLYDGLLYLFSGNNAMLSVLQANSGNLLIEAERIEGMQGVYASPVGAAGRVYLVGRDGSTVVLTKAAQLEVLARNKLDDGFDASPALAGADIFLRGRAHLYCLASSPTAAVD